MQDLRTPILGYVQHETISDYLEGVRWLRSNGFRIYGVVCDGMRGLMQAMFPYPVQMCQFHQMMIVRRYLTQDPDLEASQALLTLVNWMTGMGRALSELLSNGMRP